MLPPAGEREATIKESFPKQTVPVVESGGSSLASGCGRVTRIGRPYGRSIPGCSAPWSFAQQPLSHVCVCACAHVRVHVCVCARACADQGGRWRRRASPAPLHARVCVAGMAGGGCAGSRPAALPLAGGSCSSASDEPRRAGVSSAAAPVPSRPVTGEPTGTCDPCPRGAAPEPGKGVDENLSCVYLLLTVCRDRISSSGSSMVGNLTSQASAFMPRKGVCTHRPVGFRGGGGGFVVPLVHALVHSCVCPDLGWNPQPWNGDGALTNGPPGQAEWLL